MDTEESVIPLYPYKTLYGHTEKVDNCAPEIYEI